MKTITVLTLLLALSTLPSTAHQHRAVGVSDTNANGTADAGEAAPHHRARRHGHRALPQAARAQPGPRPEGYHPELRGGGHYYLDERPA